MSLLFAEIFQIELPTQDIISKIIEQKIGIEFEEEYIEDREKIAAEQSSKDTISLFRQEV